LGDIEVGDLDHPEPGEPIRIKDLARGGAFGPFEQPAVGREFRNDRAVIFIDGDIG
jgi:hypothetical protein